MQGQELQFEWVCCQCEPNDSLDDLCLVLYRRTCPLHGAGWHRKMVRTADGALMLAVARKPPDSVKSPSRKAREDIA